MQCPRILVITGAAGSGRTALVDALEARGIAGASFYHFDSERLEPAGSATGARGTTPELRDQALNRWIARLAESSGLAVIEGEIPLRAARAAFSRFNVDGHLLVIDSDAASAVDDAAARELKGEAQALGVPVIDISTLSLEEATERLHAQVASLAAV